MLDKSRVYDVLAEGMYFWEKSSPSNFNFLGVPLLAQISHVIFETKSQFLYKFEPFSNILAKI